MPTHLAVCVTGCHLEGGGLRAEWSAVASTGQEVTNDSTQVTVGQSVAQTNNAIETDARAKMLSQQGVTIDGTTIVLGGRTS